MKQKITKLEQEKEQLQYELQTNLQDGSQSDVSEAVREQHKELIDALHHKNKQMSSLLRDIEVILVDLVFVIQLKINFCT